MTSWIERCQLVYLFLMTKLSKFKAPREPIGLLMRPPSDVYDASLALSAGRVRNLALRKFSASVVNCTYTPTCASEGSLIRSRHLSATLTHAVLYMRVRLGRRTHRLSFLAYCLKVTYQRESIFYHGAP